MSRCVRLVGAYWLARDTIGPQPIGELAVGKKHTMMDQLRDTSQRAEVLLNSVAAPLKPYLSHIGRFLLVVTFLEDALRIFFQWPEQIRFMTTYRNFPTLLAHIFLIYCVTMMVGGSLMGLARFRTPIACGMLASVVVVQTLGYGLLRHASFMLRNFSLIGGILLLLAESMSSGDRRARGVLFAGLPNITETEKGTYVSLFGRILLILLFAALGLQGKFTPLSIVFATIAGISCVMVAVGFKARYSAMFLVAILSVANIVINPWWMHSSESAERDFLRYDFFQWLSIMGGFLLLANTGPGELSLDEKKKAF